MTIRVLHLTGSPTSAFWGNLSRVYATDCLATAAARPELEPVVAWIEPDGRWKFPAGIDPAAVDAAESGSLPQALRRIADLQVDVVVPHLFCRAGMTDYRALLDVAGLPYVGNTAAVMAIAADKAWSRALVAAAGVDVPRAEVLTRDGTPTLPLPLVVKPVDADNSTGVSLVRDAASLPAALAGAFEHGPRVLAEAYVPAGREVRCGVLDIGDGPVALPLEEYRLPTGVPIRGEDDKLGPATGGGLQLMAKAVDRAWIVNEDDPVTAAVQAAALRCHAALGCRDHGLFDFRIDPDGRPWFIEAGLYCSFAEQSVVSTMARAAGWATADLLAASIHAARRRSSATESR